MKQMIYWPQVWGALLAAGLNVASNILAAMFASSAWWLVAIFLAAVTIAGIVYWFTRPRFVEAVIKEPLALRMEEECRRHAQKGLIACPSLYTPNRGSPAEALSKEEKEAAARQKAYSRLDFPRSNLATTIKAVTTHSAKLEHCWFISTSSTEASRGASDVYIPALIEYLRQEQHVACEFHYGPAYCVPQDDDTQMTSKTRDIVCEIFEEARGMGLMETDLIADITGGMRSISLGIILACLDGRRKVEFIGSHYDGNGRFTGEPFPILFDYEPRIVER